MQYTLFKVAVRSLVLYFGVLPVAGWHGWQCWLCHPSLSCSAHWYDLLPTANTLSLNRHKIFGMGMCIHRDTT